MGTCISPLLLLYLQGLSFSHLQKLSTLVVVQNPESSLTGLEQLQRDIALFRSSYRKVPPEKLKPASKCLSGQRVSLSPPRGVVITGPELFRVDEFA